MSVPYGARHTFLHESLVKKSNFAASVSPLRGSTYVSTPYALDSKYLGVSVSPLRGSTYVSTGQIAAYKHVLDGVSPLRGSTYVSTLKQYPLQQNNKVSVPYGARHTFLPCQEGDLVKLEMGVSPLRGSTYVSTPHRLQPIARENGVSPLRGSTYVSTTVK